MSLRMLKETADDIKEDLEQMSGDLQGLEIRISNVATDVQRITNELNDWEAKDLSSPLQSISNDEKEYEALPEIEEIVVSNSKENEIPTKNFKNLLDFFEEKDERKSQVIRPSKFLPSPKSPHFAEISDGLDTEKSTERWNSGVTTEDTTDNIPSCPLQTCMKPDVCPLFEPQDQHWFNTVWEQEESCTNCHESEALTKPLTATPITKPLNTLQEPPVHERLPLQKNFYGDIKENPIKKPSFPQPPIGTRPVYPSYQLEKRTCAQCPSSCSGEYWFLPPLDDEDEEMSAQLGCCKIDYEDDTSTPSYPRYSFDIWRADRVHASTPWSVVKEDVEQCPVNNPQSFERDGLMEAYKPEDNSSGIEEFELAGSYPELYQLNEELGKTYEDKEVNSQAEPQRSSSISSGSEGVSANSQCDSDQKPEEPAAFSEFSQFLMEFEIRMKERSSRRYEAEQSNVPAYTSKVYYRT